MTQHNIIDMPKHIGKITVIVKGDTATAVLAANERGIVLHDIQAHPQLNEVIARADYECKPEIMQWWNAYQPESVGTDVPAGMLLFFSDMRTLHSAAEARVDLRQLQSR